MKLTTKLIMPLICLSMASCSFNSRDTIKETTYKGLEIHLRENNKSRVLSVKDSLGNSFTAREFYSVPGQSWGRFDILSGTKCRPGSPADMYFDPDSVEKLYQQVK